MIKDLMKAANNAIFNARCRADGRTAFRPSDLELLKREYSVATSSEKSAALDYLRNEAPTDGMELEKILLGKRALPYEP